MSAGAGGCLERSTAMTSLLLLLTSSIAKMWCLTSREGLEVLAADSVGR